jgi:PadR family transcriptional regulator, regulatory protein PadR
MSYNVDMSEKKEFVGQFEEILLLAILHLGEQAYGARVRQAVEEAMEKSVAIGAVYTTLDRLERKGYVSSWQGEPTPERGGRAKRYFRVEGAGEQVLKDTQGARERLTAGLILDPAGGAA